MSSPTRLASALKSSDSIQKVNVFNGPSEVYDTIRHIVVHMNAVGGNHITMPVLNSIRMPLIGT